MGDPLWWSSTQERLISKFICMETIIQVMLAFIIMDKKWMRMSMLLFHLPLLAVFDFIMGYHEQSSLSATDSTILVVISLLFMSSLVLYSLVMVHLTEPA